ncbi:hypothetical protein UFOVP1475_39 [uncultured Caudovirales phage]|jgi:hypothetical protein|uniref:Uncharacterized protein n=1 Tax=uncultured Caudovirales phage TaxID=2100421 RepID=A0A6J5SLP0_9CAUD|nr:hypothetical protein UFOVP1475_39 [uncultured Caudovirales phage]
MIANIIDLLNSSEHYGVSDRVEIAKGKYEIPYTWKGGWIKIKRIWLTRKLKSK